MRVAYRQLIRRPVADVFAFVSDPRRLPEWVEEAAATEVPEGFAPGPGQRFTHVFGAGPGREEVPTEVTRFQPNEHYQIRLAGRRFGGTVSYRFSSQDGGTRIDQISDLHMRGVMPRLLTPLIRRKSRQRLERNYARLARLLEQQPG